MQVAVLKLEQYDVEALAVEIQVQLLGPLLKFLLGVEAAA